MAAAAAMLLTACEKDHDGVFQGAAGGGSGKQVVKITFIDYKKSYSDYRLQYTYGYAYGSKLSWSGNNPSRIEAFGYENGAEVPEEKETENVSYVYDGGTLKEIKVSDNNGEYTITDHLTYSNGQVTEIYTTYEEDGNYDGWRRQTLTYTNGKIGEITILYSDGDIARTVLTWNGDNVVRTERYRSDGSLDYTYDYTYDNKNNPMKLDLAVALIFGDYGGSLSANNVIMETRTSSSGSTYTYSYVYTYDGDYPVKCVRTERDNNTGSYYSQGSETTYYEYADGTGRGQVPQIYTIYVQSNVADWGNVSSRGFCEYAAGSTAVIQASPLYGYEFRQWSDGNTDNPRAITVNANAAYTAIFGSSSK